MLETCETIKSIAFTMPCAKVVGLQALKEVRGIEVVGVSAEKLIDYRGTAGVCDYWLVTEDHQFYSKHCVLGQGIKVQRHWKVQ